MLCDGLQKNKDMAKELELSKWEAKRRLSLFLKLRKGKTITEKTVKDFDKLLDKMYMNFKDHEDGTISEWLEKDFESKGLALKAIRCQFMKFEWGGNCRLSDIDNFSLYKDEKYRATIKGELREISQRDFYVLQYIVFGER